MFGVSGSALAAGGVLTYFAFQQESAAQSFLDERGRRELTSDALDLYTSTRKDRDTLRLAAGASFAASAILGLGGALFFALDEGSVSEEPGADQQRSSRQARGMRAVPYAVHGEVGLVLGGAL
jgi:hypothetical protein